MKVEYRPVNKDLRLTSETKEDMFVLGKLSGKVRNSKVYSADGDGNRELSIPISELLNAALERNP